MSVADTAKDVIRIASTAGLAKDVIDLMEKKLALITDELDATTRKNALLEQRVSELETDNGQLQKKLSTGQTPIGDGERALIKLMVAGGNSAYLEQMARTLGIPLTKAQYFADNLKNRDFARLSFVAHGTCESNWSLTPTGIAYAVENGLADNVPPPPPTRSPRRA